jgi:hypothetical protein
LEKGEFMQSYTTWFMHQLSTVTDEATNAPANMDRIHEGNNGMQSLLHDIFPMHDIRVDEGVF